MIVGNIYQYKKHLSITIVIAYFLSVFCFIIALLLNSGDNTVWSKFFVILIFLSMVVMAVFNPIKIVGKIIFTNNGISVTSPSLCKTFKVNDINKITFIYYGYKGQFIASPTLPLASNKGDANQVIFNYKGIEFKFRFQIVDANFIGKLIKQWKSLSQLNIRIYNENKKIIWTNYR